MSRARHLLVIDDDLSFRHYLRRYLEIAGYKVTTADTGQEGLRLAKKHRPDLVFLDLCLGLKSRLSASDTLRALKQDARARNIPVIAISGAKEAPGDEALIRRQGADEFLTKAEIDERGKSYFLRRVDALLMLNPSTVLPAAAPALAAPASSSGLIFTVLVIDDDDTTAELLKTILSKQPDYRILSANDGAKGLRMAASEMPDLVILDLMMPGMCGKEVCRRLREQDRTFYLPVMILTGDLRSKQEIDCIELGADDYLVKPVNASRLAARIRGLIRRCRFRGNSKGIVKIGGISLNIATRRLTVGDQAPVSLTSLENGLCALLMSAEGKLVDKKALYKKIYNSWPPLGSASIKVHIGNIRKKLGKSGKLILSHKEQGYGFNVEYARAAAVKGK